MKEPVVPATVSAADRVAIEKHLQRVRHDSLIAMRRGDYKKVAQLSAEAARLKNGFIAGEEAGN